MRKFGGSSSQAHTSPDQVCVSHPNLLTPPVTPLEMPKHEHVNSLPQAIDEETGTSDTDSYPGDHRHDDLLEQAELTRKAEHRKLDFLQQEYGDYIDDSPAFVNPTHENHLPPSLTGIDRVIVKAHYEDLEDRERNALQKARFFRDRCGQLEQKCLQLKYQKHKEVEGTRYFWRNMCMEGSTRTGKIMANAYKQNAI